MQLSRAASTGGSALGLGSRALFGVCLASLSILACLPSTERSPETGVEQGAIQDEAARELASARVTTGAEVVARSGFSSLHGMRVGLITNATGRVGGRHLADALFENPNVELVRLFAPEHGLRGAAEAGELVADEVDSVTGVPVVSLYGSSKAPAADALDGLDILIFDLQDVGARFYTYIATMGLAMQAAARQEIPFLVLDRPNPLGGERIEGFVDEARDRRSSRPSLVDLYPIPIVHGMTVAELARMIRGERWLADLESLDLRVVAMEGWSRSDSWTDTGLEWTPPSPNLPDPQTAWIYPGTCLFEGTVWSEGRGTEAPFLIVGGVGLDADALLRQVEAAALPGLGFEVARFVPRSLPGRAGEPKGEGKEHSGLRLRVVDPRRLEPVRTGVALLRVFLDQSGTGLEGAGLEGAGSEGAGSKQDASALLRADWLDRLAGSDRLRILLLEGRSAAEIARAWGDDVAAFERRREPYLLYR